MPEISGPEHIEAGAIFFVGYVPCRPVAGFETEGLYGSGCVIE